MDNMTIVFMFLTFVATVIILALIFKDGMSEEKKKELLLDLLLDELEKRKVQDGK